MQSSPLDQQQTDLMPALKSLLAADDIVITGRKGGGNSVVFCVELNGEKLAIKSYPPFAPGKRDRLAAEVMVYQFLNEHNIQSVPKLIKYSTDSRLLVMEWIEGEIPAAYRQTEIEQAISFIESIANLNKLPESKKLPMAAEACLSLDIILNQVKARLVRLQSVDDAELKSFLNNEFEPVLKDCEQRAKDGYRAANMSIDGQLPFEKRSLIPADFGFHNSILDANDKLHFFDFDYFGWDDPVKLLVDILWHPKMILTSAQQQRFINGIANVYRTDDTFLVRFKHTRALFGLRWTLIFLNEFLPEFWQNRQHAAVHLSQADAKVKQLKRARATLQHVQKIGSQYDIISETSI
jgi:Phosphotransferase enzyme family